MRKCSFGFCLISLGLCLALTSCRKAADLKVPSSIETGHFAYFSSPLTSSESASLREHMLYLQSSLQQMGFAACSGEGGVCGWTADAQWFSIKQRLLGRVPQFSDWNGSSLQIRAALRQQPLSKAVLLTLLRAEVDHLGEDLALLVLFSDSKSPLSTGSAWIELYESVAQQERVSVVTSSTAVFGALESLADEKDLWPLEVRLDRSARRVHVGLHYREPLRALMAEDRSVNALLAKMNYIFQVVKQKLD